MKKNFLRLTVGVLLIACVTLASTSCGAIFDMAGEALDGMFDGVSILDMLSGNKEEDTATISGMGQCDLYYLDNDGNWQTADQKADLFKNDCWEPGCYVTQLFKVENVGEETAFYRINLSGEFSELANVIDVYRRDGEAYPESGDLEGYTRLGRLSDMKNKVFASAITKTASDNAYVTITPSEGVITTTGSFYTVKPGETVYFTMVLKMDETAGNEYQGLELGQVGASIMTINYAFSANPNDGNVEFETKYYVTTGEGFYYKPIE